MNVAATYTGQIRDNNKANDHGAPVTMATN